MLRSLCLALLLLAVSAQAQQTPTPGFALEAEEIESLRLGETMGKDRLATAFELTSYDELMQHSEALQLDPFQHGRIAHFLQTATQESRNLGEAILEQEAVLENLFRQDQADPRMVEAYAAQIGMLRGRLRAVHLTMRVQLQALLGESQRQRLSELRAEASAQ